MNLVKRLWAWFIGWLAGWFVNRHAARKQPLTVRQINGDIFPAEFPSGCIVELIDDGPYAAALKCPCGCGDTIELMLMLGVKPRWDLQVDAHNRPTLHPSVWRQSGCRSHFWVRDGEIIWCK